MFSSLALLIMLSLQVASPGAELQTTPRELIRNQTKIKIQQNIAETQQVREEKQQEFQSRLQLIENERQKNILENLNNRFETVAKNMLEHYANALDRLTYILDKLETKADVLEQGEQDVAEIRVSIDVARQEIENAKNSLLEDFGTKVYVLEVDENNLGQNIRGQIANFKQESNAIKLEISNARNSVGEVLDLLKEIENNGQ